MREGERSGYDAVQRSRDSSETGGGLVRDVCNACRHPELFTSEQNHSTSVARESLGRRRRTASEGFFDVHDAPPWGTWVGYFEDSGPGPDRKSYLLEWVPERLVDLANAGIDVNPVQCIAWLSDVQVEVRSIIDDALG